MVFISRLIIFMSLCLLPALPSTSHASTPAFASLSRADRVVAHWATLRAGHDRGATVRWLRGQPVVRSAATVRGGGTIQVQFRDGSRLAILPALRRAPVSSVHLRTMARSHVGATGSMPRALVLEPFATELQLGPDAGSDVAAALTSAGFQVDILRNADVTVDVMKTLPAYSVVYDETHSGVLSPAGDALMVVGQLSPNGPPTGEYATFFADHSLLQASVAGDPTGSLYFAVTDTFFAQHVDRFPASSLVFFNGCELLNASRLWTVFSQKGVSTFLSWDAKARVDDDELTAGYVMSHLSTGETVQTSIDGALAHGYGQSYYDGNAARFGYLGDGGNTLQRARKAELDPTATPTLTATATPMPAATATAAATATPRPTKAATRRHRCKPHHHRSHGRCVKTHPKH